MVLRMDWVAVTSTGELHLTQLARAREHVLRFVQGWVVTNGVKVEYRGRVNSIV